MRFIPVVITNIHPALYEQAKDHLLNMNYADYFYIISYPLYCGYRIEHDPMISTYCSVTEDSTLPNNTTPFNPGTIIIGIVAIGIVIGGIIIFKKRK